MPSGLVFDKGYESNLDLSENTLKDVTSTKYGYLVAFIAAMVI